MHRYNNIEFLMKFDIDMILEMYEKAIKENMMDQLWQQFLVDYSRMDNKHFVSWADYQKEFTKPAPQKVDVKEALKDAEMIKRLDQNK